MGTREAKLNKLFRQKLQRNRRMQETRERAVQFVEERRALAQFEVERLGADQERPVNVIKKPSWQEVRKEQQRTWMTYISAFFAMTYINDTLEIAHTDTKDLVAMIREEKQQRSRQGTPEATERPTENPRTSLNPRGSAQMSLSTTMMLSRSITKLRGKTTAQMIAHTKQLQGIYQLAELEEDDGVAKIVPFIQLFTKGKITVRRARSAAALVHKMMHGWSKAGNLVLAARTFYFRCRKVQMWWRKYRDLMYKFNARMIERFTEAETQLCNEISRRSTKRRTKDRQWPRRLLEMRQNEELRLERWCSLRRSGLS